MWQNNFYWSLQAFALRIKCEISLYITLHLTLKVNHWKCVSEKKKNVQSQCHSVMFKLPDANKSPCKPKLLYIFPPAPLTAKGHGAGRYLSIWTALKKNSAPVRQTGDLYRVGTQKHYAANAFNTALPTSHWNYISSPKHTLPAKRLRGERG